MGVACGDFDGDGRLDLAVTNFYGESTTLYHNHGDGLFSDRTAAAGLAAPTRFVLGFGLAALDANNDGRLDLAQANGHVADFRPTTPYAMPAQLFLGDGAGKLRDVSERAGAPWQVLRLGRGLAAGDLDNDGRIDLLLVAENAPLALLHSGGAEEPAASRRFAGTLPDAGARGNGLQSRRRRRQGRRDRRGRTRSPSGSAAAATFRRATAGCTSAWGAASKGRPHRRELASRPGRCLHGT